MHISSQKEASWNTVFSIFERRRGPPNVAGPGKTPPPLDGPGAPPRTPLGSLQSSPRPLAGFNRGAEAGGGVRGRVGKRKREVRKGKGNSVTLEQGRRSVKASPGWGRGDRET